MPIISSEKNKPNPIFRIFFSKIFLLAIIIALIFLGRRIYYDYNESKMVKREIQNLKEEIIALEQNNLEFSKLMDYLNSRDFIEKTAREKMGLKKEGEEVAVIVREDKKENEENRDINQKIAQKEQKNIFSLWWKYFFN